MQKYAYNKILCIIASIFVQKYNLCFVILSFFNTMSFGISVVADVDKDLYKILLMDKNLPNKICAASCIPVASTINSCLLIVKYKILINKYFDCTNAPNLKRLIEIFLNE